MKKLLANLKVSKKLTVSFAIIISLFVITLITSIFLLFKVSNSLTNFYNVSYQNRAEIIELRRNMQSASKNFLWSITTENETQVNQRLNDAQSNLDALQKSLDFLHNNFPDKELISSLDSASSKLKSLGNDIMNLSGEDKNSAAMEIFNTEFTEAVTEVQRISDDIATFTSNVAETDYSTAIKLRNRACFITVVMTILSIYLGIYLAVALTKNFTNPINELKLASQSLSKGELNINIEYTSNDELGELANGFRETCSNIKIIISDLNNIMKEMAILNLNVRTASYDKYTGEFAPLLENFKATFGSLSTIIGDITKAAEQVSFGSTQMSESAQNLAERATEQSSAIEQIQATVTDVGHQIEINAQEIYNVDEKIRLVGNEAEISNQEMKAMTESMNHISDTSKKIENIITEIENIASQTNLLSLNAAIEAARAGEAGKGFAVVATQIRQLADESAQSAVSTRELIETSINEVERGSAITEKTASSLSNVISGVKEIEKSINSINISSEKQATAIKQVVVGIDQISSVVQDNSATAEETSATSQELSSQALSLNEVVTKFTLRD